MLSIALGCKILRSHEDVFFHALFYFLIWFSKYDNVYESIAPDEDGSHDDPGLGIDGRGGDEDGEPEHDQRDMKDEGDPERALTVVREGGDELRDADDGDPDGGHEEGHDKPCPSFSEDLVFNRRERSEGHDANCDVGRRYCEAGPAGIDHLLFAVYRIRLKRRIGDSYV